MFDLKIVYWTYFLISVFLYYLFILIFKDKEMERNLIIYIPFGFFYLFYKDMKKENEEIKEKIIDYRKSFKDYRK